MGLGLYPERKEALKMNSEPKRSTEPHCPLIKASLRRTGGFYLTSCPGPEAFFQKQPLLFTRTCFASKSFHI